MNDTSGYIIITHSDEFGMSIEVANQKQIW